MSVESGTPQPASARLEQALLEERVQQHQDGGPSSAAASALFSFGLAWLLWPLQQPLLPVAALSALVVMQIGRLLLSSLHVRAAAAGKADAATWLGRYRGYAVLHGVGWGVYAVVLQGAIAPQSEYVLTLGMGLLVVGALVVLGFDIVAAIGYALPATTPVALTVLSRAEAGQVAAQLALVMAVGVFGALRSRRHMLQTARRRVDDAARAAESQALAAAAEAARREAAERHRLIGLLLANTTEGFWFIDLDGVTQDLNPAMCRLLGRPREQVLGHRASEFFEGESLATLRAQIERRRRGETSTYEIDIRRPDGSVVHCVNAATPLPDAEGRPAGSVGIWTDISEQRRHEEALRIYERVTNSISDPLSVIGEDLVYRMVNDAWCRVSGLAREQAVGRRSDEALPQGYNDARRRAWSECLALRQPRSVTSDVDLPALAGRIVETTYYPYDEPDGQRSVVVVHRDVTEREAGRRKLAEAAEYLQRTLNATGDGIFASDAEDAHQPVRYANEQMLRIWGIPAEKAATLTPADIMAAATPLFLHPERELQRVTRIVSGNLADESVVPLRDGRVITRRCEPALVGGRTIRVWSFRDITAESRALQVSLEREAEQRALLDAIPGFIARVDQNGVYTYVNRRLAALVGQEPEQIVGSRFGSIGDAGRLAPLEAMLQEALKGRTTTAEYRYQRDPEQPPTDVQVTVVPGVHPGTGAPAVYGFGIDISDLTRAQESLRAREAEQRALLESFPGYIGAVDGQLRYQFVNDALAHRIGRPAADVVGCTVEEVLGPELGAQIAADLRRAEAGERPQVDRHYPARGDLPELDLVVTHVAAPPRPDGRRLYYAFGIDITRRKRAEEALIAARDEAERANRAKSQFLSQMSHELRTPLNAILGLGQLLGSDPQRPLPPVQQGYADEMLRGARHLLELINDVLDLGRVESGHLGLETEAVALEPLVAETLALVRPLAQQRDVQLSTVSMPGLAVRADRRRLKQVLLNLISNAIKYNRRPGSVRIECRLDGARVRVGVRDTGRGLSAAELARLFEPFERLDAARRGVEGSGIGLALSRRLVEAMGGSLDVDSEPEVGSLFSFGLPMAEAPPRLEDPPAPAAAAAATPPVAGTPLVLYIEDNPVNVFVMEAMFERLPEYRLVCALTPAEGLQLARAEQPALILLDVQMPEMNGPEVLQRLRAREDTRAIPVVAVSADAMAENIAVMVDAGAAAYLTKPVELEDLVAALQRHARVVTAPRG
ncbi:MAG: PAS domain-containing protein [Rubrivivax sp.]|nr:PAS domain-containing protein [Rubrivivax sp.]